MAVKSAADFSPVGDPLLPFPVGYRTRLVLGPETRLFRGRRTQAVPLFQAPVQASVFTLFFTHFCDIICP